MNRLPIKCSIDRALHVARQIESGKLYPEDANIYDIHDMAVVLVALVNETKEVYEKTETLNKGLDKLIALLGFSKI